jgi:hypothetical protein
MSALWVHRNLRGFLLAALQRAQVRSPSLRTSGFREGGARSTFKAALELARTFPFGVLASRVCPYCYNAGYSSPGTRCGYCRCVER